MFWMVKQLGKVGLFEFGWDYRPMNETWVCLVSERGNNEW